MWLCRVVCTNVNKNNFKVTVIDLEIYGNHLKNNVNLELIKGDIRDKNLLKIF